MTTKGSIVWELESVNNCCYSCKKHEERLQKRVAELEFELLLRNEELNSASNLLNLSVAAKIAVNNLLAQEEQRRISYERDSNEDPD